MTILLNSLRIMKNYKFIITATLVFIGCLAVGYWIAVHKPLWNDEFYTQLASIHSTSYVNQFLGHVPEGGNSPLFYVLQKLFLQLIHYQVPSPWLQGQWINDHSSQILLRINPVIFMSLSITLVFYYFYREHSFILGLYSLLIYLSSYMLWVYWAEARPYALVVFLSTVQSLVFLRAVKGSERLNVLWKYLAFVNLLMGFTFIFSIGQICAVSLLWWCLFDRDWKKYFFITMLPVAAALFYYTCAPKYHFFFGLSPQQLIHDNVSRERLDVLIIYFVFLLLYGVGQKNPMIKVALGQEILRSVPYGFFMVLVLGASAVVLWFFALHATVPQQGFPVSSRYFIYLMPMGVIGATFLSASVVKSLYSYRLLQMGLIIFIGYLFVFRFFKVVPGAIHSLVGG